MAANIAEREQRRAEREQRRAELERRDSEHGGMVSIDRLVADQARRDALRDWRAYRPSVTAAEVTAARRGEVSPDPRRIALGRLFVDCGAAARRFAPAFKRSAAETLRNDALLLLVRWPNHGAAPRQLDLGGESGTPLRRDWLERGEDGRERLTALAWRALHAAIKQASESPSARAELEQDESEQATDPLDISRLVELEQRAADDPTRLPDSAAPETIARLLDLPLDAARAIVARAYPAATPADLAADWNISPDSLKVALSRGAAMVRERFPDYGDLLRALDRAAETYRQEVATDATLALLNLRNGRASEAEATSAALAWRSVSGELAPQRRALIVAALRAARLNGASGESAERVAASVARIMAAEQRRGQRMAASGARSSHLPGARDAAGRMSARIVPAPPLPARPMVGPLRWSPDGDGYSGACSCLYLYRGGQRHA